MTGKIFAKHLDDSIRALVSVLRSPVAVEGELDLRT
jgi:hypothetical protein